jgi:hypothetical protein
VSPGLSARQASRPRQSSSRASNILSSACLCAGSAAGQVNSVPVARKTKRRQPARPRRPTAPAAPATGGGTSRVAPRAAPAGRVGGDQALVRSVEMSLAPGQGPPARRGGRIVLEGGDPAIPLDRVPYFITDLIRLGLVAAVMVVLLIVGALLVVPRFIH